MIVQRYIPFSNLYLLSYTSRLFDEIGQCEGTADHIVDGVYNKENCLKICQSTPNCQWFTFQRPSSQCILLSNCVEISDDGSSVSGERRCQIEQLTTSSPTMPVTTTKAAQSPKGFTIKLLKN
jgi:hypothetical protein